MNTEKKLLNIICTSLEDSKAEHPVIIDLSDEHSLTGHIVVCHGNSNRHVKAIASRLIDDVKLHNFRPLGVEGLTDAEWILIDLNDVIVHIMQPSIRSFYQLEKLWQHVSQNEEV